MNSEKYIPPVIEICYPKTVDIVTTSLPDTGDEYEGEIDWNML